MQFRAQFEESNTVGDKGRFRRHIMTLVMTLRIMRLSDRPSGLARTADESA